MVCIGCDLAQNTAHSFATDVPECIDCRKPDDLFVIAKQIRNGYELGFEWPNLFSAAHGLVLVSLALLAVDVVVEGLVGGWRRTVDDDFDREKT